MKFVVYYVEKSESVIKDNNWCDEMKQHPMQCNKNKVYPNYTFSLDTNRKNVRKALFLHSLQTSVYLVYAVLCDKRYWG